MKFTCQVDINKPIDEVMELFDNADNLKEWQDGFESFEHLSGSPGEPGAKSRIVYQQGKRRIELIETMIKRDLPGEFSATYEHIHMVNTMNTRFESLDENQTRYIMDIEYTQFNGFMIKAMAFLMPGMFRKQTQKWMDQFKVFVEGV